MKKILQNIIKGAGSILVLAPDSEERYNRIHPYKSDAEALRHSWEKVGKDMQKVFVRAQGAHAEKES